MERISIEELLKRNVNGTIVTTGKTGIAVAQVCRIVHVGEDLRIDIGMTLRTDPTDGRWRRTTMPPHSILAESRVKPFTLPGSIGLLRKDGRGMVCVRTDATTPIVVIKGMREIPFPNFANL